MRQEQKLGVDGLPFQQCPLIFSCVFDKYLDTEHVLYQHCNSVYTAGTSRLWLAQMYRYLPGWQPNNPYPKDWF